MKKYRNVNQPAETEEEARPPSRNQRRREHRYERRHHRENLRRPPQPWELRGKSAQREEANPEELAHGWWGEFDDVKNWYEKEEKN